MSEIEGLTPEAIQAGVKAYETGMSDDGRSRPECIVLAYFAIQEALATASPAVRTPEDQVSILTRQAHD